MIFKLWAALWGPLVICLIILRYLAVRGRAAPRGSAAWDDASDELIEYCARCWANYSRERPARFGVH